MRVRKTDALGLGALLFAATMASAQPKPAEPPAAAEKPAEKAAEKAPEAGKGDKPAAAAEEKEKKPTITPGYSWSDKPAKPGKWRPKKKLDPNAPIATFPGFRMNADGSSQVWVHVTKKVNVTGSGTAFALVGAQVNVRNNTNALVTEYFDTPLARAKLKADASGAQFVLELREAVTVKHRVVDGPGGSMMLYVDLPKAQKSYSVRDDFEQDPRRARRGGKVLPGSRGSKKYGPKQ